jgi:hypothetical protein
MDVARQEWLDWEFDPSGFSKYGCDDIGDLLASGQMSVEFLDDEDDYLPMTAARLEENRLRHSDINKIGAELRKTMVYLDGETERQYEERLTWELTRRVGEREDQRAKERIERGLPDLDHNPNAL